MSIHCSPIACLRGLRYCYGSGSLSIYAMLCLLLIVSLVLSRCIIEAKQLLDEVMAYQSITINLLLNHSLLPALYSMAHWSYDCGQVAIIWYANRQVIQLRCLSDETRVPISLWTDDAYQSRGGLQSLYYQKLGHNKVEMLSGVSLKSVDQLREGQCDFVWEYCSPISISQVACARVPEPGYCLGDKLCWVSRYQSDCSVK